MALAWSSLLSSERISKSAGSPPPQANPFRTPFEADYDRVIYSTAFRRLARKTQVHPLALNDHVRTRLTHSLEVSGVGRGLGKRLGDLLQRKGTLPQGLTKDDLAWIMMAACAAHDIGNPPFGHAGEYAIREWFSTHSSDMLKDLNEPARSRVSTDLEQFEGNAQGFRIAARSDNPKTGYLRLTYATLGAMIKYPWGSSDNRAIPKGKFNYFWQENDIFDRMMVAMGLASEGGGYLRHPLSFLTEAADDICYRMLDLEDAVELRIFNESEVSNIYQTIAGETNATLSLAELRGKAIGVLIDGMWSVFESKYEDIMEGKRTDPLQADLDDRLQQGLKDVKKAYETIFAERSKVAAELGAYKALGRILKALLTSVDRLTEKKNIEDAGFVAGRCLELAWGADYVREHAARSREWWLYQITDYVAGLTDNYARQLSREIEGT